MKRVFTYVAGALMLTACTTGTQKAPYELIAADAFDTTLNGRSVQLYTLVNKQGMAAQITNYGARLVSLWVPAADGSFKDVVWGYETIADYLDAGTDVYSGPVVGRYGNRINKGQFTLDGKSYQLTINDGENHLHGGSGGFWSKVWQGGVVTNADSSQSVVLTYESPDGEEGYPGNLTITVMYTLTNDNQLVLNYEATTDAPTVINPTSHSYFNLHGTTAQSTNSHILQINADSFTPTDAGLIPTGEIAPVEGTPLDFRQPTAIGERIEADFEPMKLAKGYDHNWVLNKANGQFGEAAVVYEPATGIVMTVSTDQPGMQFYSGNFMDGKDVGKRGDLHSFRTGVAFETQNFPDAPNHPEFPNPVLRPGETYTQTCVYAFSTK